MSSSSTSPESWIGKLVWIFLRDDQGLLVSNATECGIVIDTHGVNRFRVPLYIVQVGDNYYSVTERDMEEVEEWSEEVEGEDGSVEEP